MEDESPTRRCSQPLAALLFRRSEASPSSEHNQYFDHLFGVAELDVRSKNFAVIRFSANLLLSICISTSACVQSENVSWIDLELSTLAVAIQRYQSREGTFPQGSNIEISRKLDGKDGNIQYIKFPRRSIDSEGRFVDPWGTPYVFAHRSDRMIIWSFGKNKIVDSAPNSDDHIEIVKDTTEQGAAANP